MRLCQRLFLTLIFATASLQASAASVADLVIFSYNRPLQLYAFLESAEALMTGTGEVHVIYRADSDKLAQGYDQVAQNFSHVKFLKQGENPAADFKPLTMAATFETRSDYVIFAVDDIIVKDFVNLSESIALMEKENAYGFYLRMGNHLTYCYSQNQKQELPPMKEVSPALYAWTFAEGAHDWGYPHSVDMTIFRKKDIRHDFERLDFTNPNTLEGRWAGMARPILNRTGLCYASSKIVNVPLNRVQTTNQNRHMGLYSADELHEMFLSGKKIDVAPLFQMANPSAHTEYEPTFVERNHQSKLRPRILAVEEL